MPVILENCISADRLGGTIYVKEMLRGFANNKEQMGCQKRQLYVNVCASTFANIDESQNENRRFLC